MGIFDRNCRLDTSHNLKEVSKIEPQIVGGVATERPYRVGVVEERLKRETLARQKSLLVMPWNNPDHVSSFKDSDFPSSDLNKFKRAQALKRQ